MVMRNLFVMAAVAMVAASVPAHAKSSARLKMPPARHQLTDVSAETIARLDAADPLIWFRASVDAAGRATDCSHSSSEPATKPVGDWFCAQLTKADTAPFVPAYDAKAQPTASDWSLAIKWKNMFAD